MTVSPPEDVRAVSRLLDHCSTLGGFGVAKPHARDRLEAVIGGELARRLVGALAGDHRMPARVLVD